MGAKAQSFTLDRPIAGLSADGLGTGHVISWCRFHDRLLSCRVSEDDLGAEFTDCCPGMGLNGDVKKQVFPCV